jgi:transposase
MTTIARESDRENATAQVQVFAGVDSHQETHTACAISATGGVLGEGVFAANRAGYAALLEWLEGYGVLVVVGIEGTGAYGAGLARWLHAHGVAMVEVDRPDRKTRRQLGKSDPIDARAAARATLAGVASGAPKTRTGKVEALRNLRVARRSAVEQRADCARQIRTLILTAPENLRDLLRGLPEKKLFATCTQLRPETTRADDPTQATKIALRSLARRHRALTREISDLDVLIAPLVEAINPDLLDLNGLGPDTAGQLLVTAGENTDRVGSEASFAKLCGVAPIPASSGKTNRHRLNRGGDRQANAALYRVVLCRLRWDPRTQAYMKRRTTEGRSKSEIIRCLKRLIAREIYYVLTQEQPRQHLQPAL